MRAWECIAWWFGDVLCAGFGGVLLGGLGMYCVQAWGCIVCRFADGDVLCVGLGMYFVRVWECIVCRFGIVFCESLGMYCV